MPIGKFTTELDADPLPDGVNWKLLLPLCYTASDGIEHAAPNNFVTDYASIPDLARMAGMVLLPCFIVEHLFNFHWIAAIAGFAFFVLFVAESLERDTLTDAPATLHDYNYRVARSQTQYTFGSITFHGKIAADFLLLECMKTNKVKAWKRYIIFFNVLVFGWGAWRKDAK